MVSIGTIFSLAIAGAVAVGGYALYRNYNKVGGAFARGVEKNVSVPFGHYLDNLWKDTATDIVGAAKDTVEKKIIEPIKNIPNPLAAIIDPLPVAYADPQSQKVSKPKLPPPTLRAVATPGAPKLIRPTESLAGWYYRNFPPGGREDTQVWLKSGTADKLRSWGHDLTFLTTSKKKLSKEGFTSFGKSKGYL